MALKKFVFSVALFASCGLVFSQPAVQAYDYEITPMMLTWKSIHEGNLGIPKLPAYKAWSKDFAANDPYVRYAEVDLNADGVKEVIVADSDFPSRGRGFLILQKQSGKLVPITFFRGGFILTRNDMKKYFKFHIFEKEYGVMTFYELQYKQGKYRLTFETELPRTIYDEGFYAKWQYLNTLDEEGYSRLIRR